MKTKKNSKNKTGKKPGIEKPVSKPVKEKKEDLTDTKKKPESLELPATSQPTEQVPMSNANKPFDLDSVMAQYSQSEAPTFQGFSAGNPSAPITANPAPTPIIAINPGPDDKSDPKRYYQSGKRKGQERPSWKQQTSKQPTQPVSTTPVTSTTGAPITNKLISPKMFMMFLNYVMPFIIAGGHNMFSKEIKIDAVKLKLTEEQNKELEPVAEEVIKYLNITMNPVLQFGIMYTGCMAMNITIQRGEARRELMLKKQTTNSGYER